MASILRMNDTKTIQLINEWEKFECLWNTKLLIYPDKEARAKAMEEIAQTLNIPNFTPWHVLTKFRNLRNSYRQELKKIAADDKYQPRVVWFPHIDRFLRPHLQKNFFKERSPNSKTADETTDEAVADNSYEEALIIKVENTSDDDEQSNESCAKRPRFAEAFTNRDGETSQKVVFEAEDTGEVSSNCSSVKDKSVKHRDHYDAFGVYVASLLRTLPPHKALLMQTNIVNSLISAGVEELNQSNNQQAE